jgi:signal transduction histidine kinase
LKRLTLSLLLVVVAAVIGLGWAIDQWYSTQQTPQEDPAINNYRQLGNLLVQLIAQTGTDEKTLNAWADQSALHLQLTPYVDFPLPENLKKSFELGEPLVLDSGTGPSLHYYLAQRQSVISFNLPLNPDKAVNVNLRWRLTLLFYMGIIFVVLVWLYPLLKRLKLLRLSAGAFGTGDLSVRIPQGGVSYIADIEQEFNRMAQKIENLIADNKLLSRGLSHDLRTTIARLRFGLDVLEEAQLTEPQQKTMAHLNRDLLAMESLVETLLRYARLEQANIALKPLMLNLHLFLLELVQSAYDVSVTIKIHFTQAEPIIFVDPEYLTMMLHNLIQNAKRHGQGQVIVSIIANPTNTTLVVEDNGAGIPIAEREHVLKPFYRAKSAQNTQGHGMGLAIVDRIAQWYKAEVILDESETLGGLKISIQFKTHT